MFKMFFAFTVRVLWNCIIGRKL